MLTQCAARVVRAEDAAFLQKRNDFVGESVKTTGRQVRHEDEAVAGCGLDVPGHLVRDRRGGAHEALASCHLDHELADREAAVLRLITPLTRDSDRVAVEAACLRAALRAFG